MTVDYNPPWGALREGRPERGVTLATDFAPFGHTTHRHPREALLHRTALVAVDWRRGRVGHQQPTIFARWMCGYTASYVRLLHEPDSGLQSCARCTATGEPRQSRVYYAQDSEGLIKIGVSLNVPARVKALGLALLGTELGNRFLEDHRHQQFAKLHVVGELFDPGADLLAHIASLNAAEPLEASA